MTKPSLSSVWAWLLTTRPLVRAPIPLFQKGFGWLLGPRLLMLEHVGRASGQPRYVCLEIARRPAAGQFIVPSGFGTRSQWYRNLRATPECFVSTGRTRHAPAIARLLTKEQSATELKRYQEARPTSWAQLEPAIEKALGHPVTEVPMVELTLAK
jgi:deazaflavin-dependent oxidoreductase (nitroreductase family)